MVFLAWKSYVQIVDESDTETKKSGSTTSDTNPTVHITNLNLREKTNKNNIIFVLNAQTSDFHHATNQINCFEITCNIEQHNHLIAHFIAKKARYNKTSQQAFIDGPVEGSFKDLNIQAENLFYSHETQTVSTDSTATYSHALFLCRAGQSIIHVADNSFEFKKGVYTEFSSRATTNKGSQ
jgi:hypothetical protein